MNLKTKLIPVEKPSFLPIKLKANWAWADSGNFKVNTAATITQSKISDIDGILILGFNEAVENLVKMTEKNRNKGYFIVTGFEFPKRFRLFKTSVAHLLELIKANAQCLMDIESHAILRLINTPLFDLRWLTTWFSN